ncbi:MAG: hypothetical protein JWO79_4250 [Actinomycetia bacterium]|nr:hypothetical protein [Actinomycetes bacterium]
MSRSFPVPLDEEARAAAVADYRIVGVPPLPDLPAIVELAADLLGVPNAVVNIITADQQVQLAAHGFDGATVPRGESMCATTIVQPEPVILRDARLDPRFASHPHVTGELGNIVFYAGSQLRAPAGHVLGTLCAFDTVAHDLTGHQREGMDKLARMVVGVLELHRHARLLHESMRDLERKSGELVRSNAALASFAGQVSHDLRNPLTGVLGYVAVLADLPAIAADPEAKFCMDRALSSATRMWRMISDVLAHASAGGHLSIQPVPLTAVAADVVDDLASVIAGTGALVSFGELPTVAGDATSLRIVLQNLVGNAVKFRHPDRPSVVHISGDEDPVSWWIAVSDNGVGIPEADRGRVLEMFSRLQPAVEGSGIGLATVQRIVDAHGGTLAIEANDPAGTVVRVTLPKLSPNGQAARPQTHAGAAGRS